MSSPRLTELPSLPTEVDDRSLTSVLLDPFRRIAFWAAIVLPFLHLPLLATGLNSDQTTLAFAILLGCNILAVIVGHPTD